MSKQGRFVWRELLTTDVAQAKSFYGELVGWSFHEVDMGPEVGPYALIMQDGRDIGGIMRLPPMSPAAHWMPYVEVDDVDACLQRTERNGGRVIVSARDIPDVGRFGVLVDPTGACITAFKYDKSRPVEPESDRMRPGSFCWEQLQTTDIEKAKRFYTETFGWKVFPYGPDIATFGIGEGPRNQVASIVTPPPGVPSRWLSHVLVPNLRQANETTKKHGGQVFIDAIDVEYGSFSLLADPWGAPFCAFQERG